MVWCQHGVYHRTDKDENGLTLPACVYANGTISWYHEGAIHNDDVDENGDDCPAIIWPDGSKYWFRNGIQYTPKLLMNIKHVPENVAESLSVKQRECAICLDEIDKKKCYCSKECFHFYHEKCLKRNRGRCSICERV
jgi:hypothetical protein